MNISATKQEIGIIIARERTWFHVPRPPGVTFRGPLSIAHEYLTPNGRISKSYVAWAMLPSIACYPRRGLETLFGQSRGRLWLSWVHNRAHDDELSLTLDNKQKLKAQKGIMTYASPRSWWKQPKRRRGYQPSNQPTFLGRTKLYD